MNREDSWLPIRSRSLQESSRGNLQAAPEEPSLVAGFVLTWARAIGEFGATVAFAGNLQGVTQTLPLAVFVTLETDRDTAIAISLVLVAVSLTVLITLRNRWLTK